MTTCMNFHFFDKETKLWRVLINIVEFFFFLKTPPLSHPLLPHTPLKASTVIARVLAADPLREMIPGASLC